MGTSTIGVVVVTIVLVVTVVEGLISETHFEILTKCTEILQNIHDILPEELCVVGIVVPLLPAAKDEGLFTEKYNQM